MRLVIATCSVDYAGRLTAHLPSATRLLLVKADGSVLVHSDGGSYKPLNWMSPPCTLVTEVDDDGAGTWTVTNKAGERLRDHRRARCTTTPRTTSGSTPGWSRTASRRTCRRCWPPRWSSSGAGWRLVRREFPTAIGPVDLMCRDADGKAVAVEIKRRGEIDGVEQLTRYLELLNRDPLLAPVRGIFAAQEIKPQARVLAGDRGIECVVLDYDAMRGLDDVDSRLF